ncbi:MAG TPA: tetratricopeptide repeat protein [Candidatus Hydrogenedentes bacterium]|nr:tetratricopeptide repeat protein [Candidatus Hydrogenedentota bacterium]HOJ67776.1 tetratricopeptide repeat protein [Candidatus Hydrogenedentota bacterium]HOK89834.1 tetratricopeptide repeat protein [Candidatus Hydrogenedentota bacterium]HPO30969.1 tetratricopeptide repeat protein [Candidatus Hydrogenedentota bacterium]
MPITSFFSRRDEEKPESTERRTRQRLVVHARNGKVLYGFSLSLNKNADAFVLDLVDRNNVSLGRSIKVPFADLKGVFYVKSFDGRFDPSLFPHVIPEGGVPIVLEFADGEIISAYASSTKSLEEPRFYVVPQDERSNNLGILVERSALTGLYRAEEYRQRLKTEFEAYARLKADAGLSRNELLGDFYFERHHYIRALQHYLEAAKEAGGEERRLMKKICAARYNIGICHMRQRDYEKALNYMEQVLKLNPAYEPALKQAGRLREKLAARASRQTGSPSSKSDPSQDESDFPV